MNFIAVQSDKSGVRSRALAQLSQRNHISPRFLAPLVAMAEMAVLVGGGLLVAGQYPGFGATIPVDRYVFASVFASILHVILQNHFGLFKLPVLLNPLPRLVSIATSWVSLFAVIVAAVLLSKEGDNFSRVWLTVWFGAGLCFSIATRVLFAVGFQFANKQGQFNRNAVIIGSGNIAEDTVAALKSSRGGAVNLVGFFDDRADVRTGIELSGLRKLGNLEDAIDFGRVSGIDLFILALPPSAEDRIAEIVERLHVLPADVKVSAVGQKLKFRPRAYSHVGNLPCIDVLDRPLGDWGPTLKSIEDKIIASIALLVLSPVLLALAIAVKLDSKGPVLFKQKRYGFNNELIEVYKFRSMYTDQCDFAAAKLVTRGDPRVTRVGRIIRRTSLDELPQIFNVLKGELSLVGPRPHATKAKAAGELYEHVVDGYFSRHKVKPGMTGWAQINGWRGETDTPDKIRNRVEFDLHYIDNWSLTLDLYIMARTPFALVKAEGAY